MYSLEISSSIGKESSIYFLFWNYTAGPVFKEDSTWSYYVITKKLGEWYLCIYEIIYAQKLTWDDFFSNFFNPKLVRLQNS